MPFRIGLIGAGVTGQLRARAIGRIDHARLTALTGASPDEVRAVRSRHPDVRLVSDPMEMAEDDGVDGVVVTTSPVTRASLGMACLRAGKHLLCEKPLAMNVAECDRLVATADATGVCLATGFMLRHTPAAQLARQLVDAGSIGRVNHVRAFHGHSGIEYFGPDFSVDATETGGGCLMDGGNHLIDMVRWFLGGIAESTGYATEGVWRQPGCEDNGFLLLRTADGRVGQLQASWSEWRGYRYGVEIYGTDGYVRFGYSPLWLVHATGRPGKRMKIRRYIFPLFQIIERLRGWQWSVVNAQEADLRSWIDAARRGGEAPASGRDGLEAVRAAQSVSRTSVADQSA